MIKNNFAFIDVETTGLDVTMHEIIQIGLVVTDAEFNILEEWEVKVKPMHIESADKTALKINKYNETDWAQAVNLKDAMKNLADKTKNCIMVAHNISFDSAFLEKVFRENKIENKMHYHKLDTLSIAYAKRLTDGDIDQLSLHALCEHFSIQNPNSHTALADARATFELFKKLIA